MSLRFSHFLLDDMVVSTGSKSLANKLVTNLRLRLGGSLYHEGKSKSEITIPILGDAYSKVMRRVIEYAKLSGIMLLSQCATPFVCFATLELGEKKMISILLCSFSLHVVAFSFRSLRRLLCLYRSSD